MTKTICFLSLVIIGGIMLGIAVALPGSDLILSSTSGAIMAIGVFGIWGRIKPEFKY
jgi:hypothetical protein